MENSISNILNETFVESIANLSDRADIEPTIVTNLTVTVILWLVYNGFMFIFTLGGNMLTIIAVRTCRRLRSIISNTFILSLAVSDFVVGLTLPYHVAFYLGSGLGTSHEFCLLRFFLIIFACCVSILTLITIAIDRYIAIVYPLHYTCLMTRRTVIVIISFNWILGASVAAIPLFWNRWKKGHQCEFDEVLSTWYILGILTPGFVLIWFFMLVIYGRIMSEASRQAQHMRERKSMQRSTSFVLNVDFKSVQVVLFIMGCFSLCWLTYFIVTCGQTIGLFMTSPSLYRVAFSLAITNSGLNPIIYAWKNSNFRRAFAQLLRCRNPNECTHNTNIS
ncbi:histamine H2 receptor [Teleopsis dalmanni]|uniref:histamine H2 receptor n=1 Tax=Teleopsis dalmanni TaxID=139649 RepID=UPI0018CC8BD6|nr:histamine H2 receptor [Teleopsis dalmanni]